MGSRPNQQLVRLAAGGMRAPCQRLLSAETKVDQIKSVAIEPGGNEKI